MMPLHDQLRRLRRGVRRFVAFLRAVHRPRYLEAKQQEIRPFAVSVTFITAGFVLCTMFWDRAIDPVGAAHTVGLRLSEAGAVLALALVMWWRAESVLTRLVTVLALLWVEVSYIEVMARLEGGASFGMGGFVYFFLFMPFISLHRSLRFNLSLFVLFALVPPVMSAAGLADHLTMDVYHAYLWLGFVAVALILLAFDMLYWGIHSRNRRLQALVRIDELTGIPNRRAFVGVARRLLDNALADSHPVSVLFLDIDHFKSINDRYGHRLGDRVLREVARRLQGLLRDTDLIGRYGGEEFGIFLYDTDRADALRTAERVRATAGEITIPGTAERLSVSIGVTTWRQGQPTEIHDLLQQADQALYEAKGAGRDAVMAYARSPGAAAAQQDLPFSPDRP